MSLVGPILATLALWWISTGVILVLGRQGQTARLVAMLVVSVLALAGLAGLWMTRDLATPMGAYIAAFSALLLWAWHEMSFLFGYITGPNKAPCPSELKGWARFKAATGTLIHHEVALAATVALLALMALGASNPVGLQLFALLFALRLSSKFNLFVGAPHFTDQLLPERLAYLPTYFSARRPGFFFAATAGSCAIASAAFFWIAGTTTVAFEAAGFALLGTLAALGALEHIFFASPLPDAALWRWLLPARETHRARDL